jgi:hypothetical protein
MTGTGPETTIIPTQPITIGIHHMTAIIPDVITLKTVDIIIKTGARF